MYNRRHVRRKEFSLCYFKIVLLNFIWFLNGRPQNKFLQKGQERVRDRSYRREGIT